MKVILLAGVCLIAGALAFASFADAANAGERIGKHKLDTPMFSMGGKEIVITAFDDPKAQGVSCHVSDVAKTGLSWGDDPSNASIACRQVGPISIAGATETKPWGNLKVSGEDVFGSTKGWFKALKVRRFVDTKRNVLVYVVFTPKWGEDSNKNVVSSVALYGAK